VAWNGTMYWFAVVDGTFGRLDPMISRSTATVGYSWLTREP
jgi:hypothetical protein